MVDTSAGPSVGRSVRGVRVVGAVRWGGLGGEGGCKCQSGCVGGYGSGGVCAVRPEIITVQD